MDDEKARALTILQQEPEESEAPDFDLRYKKDPVEAISECRNQFRQNESGYRENRLRLVATIYAISLRLVYDDEAQDRFFDKEYSQRVWRRHIRTSRDLFREIFKYVTEEDNKIASKYAKVIWLLSQANIHPGDAAYVIHRSGGIEKMVREGIYKPEYFNPRDVGDGMDANGKKIEYPDEESKPQKKDNAPRVQTTNEQLLFDYVDSAPTPSGTVHIIAKYAQGLRKPVVQFLTIEPAPPSADAGPPPLAIAPIEMTRGRREWLGGLSNEKLWMYVERRLTEAGTEKFVATKFLTPHRGVDYIFHRRSTRAADKRARRASASDTQGSKRRRMRTRSIRNSRND